MNIPIKITKDVYKLKPHYEIEDTLIFGGILVKHLTL